MALLGSGKMLRGQMSTISGPAAVCSTLLRPQLRDGQASGDPGESKSPLSLFFFFNFIGVWLIYNVLLVSSVQQSDSVIHIRIFILFQIFFLYILSQNIE